MPEETAYTLDEIETAITAMESTKIDTDGESADNSADGTASETVEAEKPISLDDLSSRIDGIEAENARLRDENARMVDMLGRMVKYGQGRIGASGNAQGSEAFPKPMSVEKTFSDTAATTANEITPLDRIVLGS